MPTILLLLLGLFICFDGGVELLFEIATTEWEEEYRVRSLSRAKLMVLHLLASSRIFLSFMPVPSNLLSKSSSVVSSFVQRISSCACCKADLPLGGLGGSGVCPFLESTDEWEESSSEYEFLRGLRYCERLTASSTWVRWYLWGSTHRMRVPWSVRSAAAGLVPAP